MWVVDVFPFIIFPFLSTLSMASALRCFFDADFLELQVYVMMTPNSTVNSSSPIHPPTIQWTSVVFICFNIELVVVDDPSADLTTMGWECTDLLISNCWWLLSDPGDLWLTFKWTLELESKTCRNIAASFSGLTAQFDANDLTLKCKSLVLQVVPSLPNSHGDRLSATPLCRQTALSIPTSGGSVNFTSITTLSVLLTGRLTVTRGSRNCCHPSAISTSADTTVNSAMQTSASSGSTTETSCITFTSRW